MNITLSDFSIASISRSEKLTNSISRIGFIMRKANSESAAQQDLEKTIERSRCILDNPQKDDFVVDLSLEKDWKKYINHLYSRLHYTISLVDFLLNPT